MRSLRVYNILPVLILTVFLSCSSYSELVIEYKLTIPKEKGYYFRDSENNTKRNNLNIISTKYLVKVRGSKPESKIMNIAVDETLKGNYAEAEILFNELTDIVNDGSVENNLGVLFETEKKHKKAMIMYINALIKSPENIIFRSNFLSFICQNRYK